MFDLFDLFDIEDIYLETTIVYFLSFYFIGPLVLFMIDKLGFAGIISKYLVFTVFVELVIYAGTHTFWLYDSSIITQVGVILLVIGLEVIVMSLLNLCGLLYNFFHPEILFLIVSMKVRYEDIICLEF